MSRIKLAVEGSGNYRVLFFRRTSMYNAHELVELTTTPKINDVSIQELQNMYNIYLMPFIYVYDIGDANGSHQIKLKFDSDNFCHLLGVESIARYQVQTHQLDNYRGELGWNNIRNNSITIKHLKQLNNRKFNSLKTKYVHFYRIPQLLEHPKAVYFDRNLVTPATSIQCEILFHDTYNDAYIHLGLDKDSKSEFYYPRTFFIEKIGNNNKKDIYVENQKEITVTKKDRIIML